MKAATEMAGWGRTPHKLVHVARRTARSDACRRRPQGTAVAPATTAATSSGGSVRTPPLAASGRAHRLSATSATLKGHRLEDC